ncbi:hypothetical protein B0H13DRAFT_2678240 [Mycena leptocephala]|nr:hypothetical protein B0H13DRAFT_2678240 [Mycena leptocephala]
MTSRLPIPSTADQSRSEESYVLPEIPVSARLDFEPSSPSGLSTSLDQSTSGLSSASSVQSPASSSDSHGSRVLLPVSILFKNGSLLDPLPPEIGAADLWIASDGSFVETSSGAAARELKRRYDAHYGVGISVRSPYAITSLINHPQGLVGHLSARNREKRPPSGCDVRGHRPAVSQPNTPSDSSRARSPRRSRLSVTMFNKPITTTESRVPRMVTWQVWSPVFQRGHTVIVHPFGPTIAFESPSRKPNVDFLPTPRLLREMQSFESGLTARQVDLEREPFFDGASANGSDGSRPRSAFRVRDSTSAASFLTDSDFAAHSSEAGADGAGPDPKPETGLHLRYSTDVFDVLQKYRGLPLLEKLAPGDETPVIKMSLSSDNTLHHGTIRGAHRGPDEVSLSQGSHSHRDSCLPCIVEHVEEAEHQEQREGQGGRRCGPSPVLKLSTSEDGVAQKILRGGSVPLADLPLPLGAAAAESTQDEMYCAEAEKGGEGLQEGAHPRTVQAQTASADTRQNGALGQSRHILGESFAAATRKASTEEEDSDVDLDFLPDEQALPDPPSDSTAAICGPPRLVTPTSTMPLSSISTSSSRTPTPSRLARAAVLAESCDAPDPPQHALTRRNAGVRTPLGAYTDIDAIDLELTWAGIC